MEQLEHQEHDRAKSEHKRTSNAMETYLKLFIPLPIHGEKKSFLSPKLYSKTENPQLSPNFQLKKMKNQLNTYICTCVRVCRIC